MAHHRLAVVTAVLAIVSAAVLTFGGSKAFADDPVPGGQTAATTTTEAAPADNPPAPPKFTVDGDPIASSAASTFYAPPTLPKGKSFQAVVKAQMGRLSRSIARYRKTTEHWNQVMGVALPAAYPRHLESMSLPALRKAALRWRVIARRTRWLAQHPPHMMAFVCIHHHEGSWTDSGGPYYGGLQMDIGFQKTYAPRLLRTKGTANHWTPLEQIWTAEKAARSRGFWPWPNTARDCGLL